MITDIDKQIETFQRQFALVTNEMAKRIVGYQDIVEGVLLSLLADGHVLLEGKPGLGKKEMRREKRSGGGVSWRSTKTTTIIKTTITTTTRTMY